MRQPARPFSGSSPLTRGKPCELIDARAAVRLIPAHAGKTSTVITLTTWKRAHPRSRGENSESEKSTCPLSGSSPLTRGKRHLRELTVEGFRLIPAHAGKTRCTRRAPIQRGAHPRSRGENPPRRPSPSTVYGSSPLTRGKRR
ncbi:hypothetical protein HMPREF0970_01428 [Schaalia odontolytica F0309]|nr:hypothetical protein HMPREF0970_01428 [Schaalia odontolytica F0309]